ncbi:MAG: MgtC/SapB family protein [Verrucomicrobia bacterium]|nr:MgtC/SapB family protein [Verrucomicrobiota bacterium]
MNSDIPFLDFAVALFIGALVGIEREKSAADENSKGIGGLRTFILFAEAGALAAWLSNRVQSHWLFAAGALCVSATVLAGYLVHTRSDQQAHGLTTEIAALVVYLLGGATLYGYQSAAVALGIATSAVLAYKEPLHGLVGKLGKDDLYAGLKLLIATFIVLPVLPDKTVDPWGALNPYKMWWLVILIASLSLIGYLASRWLGTHRGIPLIGLFGGLVSSTAVSLTFARRSHEGKGGGNMADALATGLLLSWTIMFARVIVEVAVVNPVMLGAVIVPMVVMGLICLGCSMVFYRRSLGAIQTGSVTGEVPLKNPFSLTSAIKFALLFAVVLLVVKQVEKNLPQQGLYIVAALAGLTDVDAITLSLASQAKSTIEPQVAVCGITVAVLANTLLKSGMVAVLATTDLKNRTLLAAAVILAGGIVSLLL